MKKFHTLAAIPAALSLILPGCITDGGMNDNPTTGMAVRFATSIVKTRAHDGVWEYGDSIGVYMLASAPATQSATAAATEPDWGSTPPLFENMLYGHNLDEGEESDNVVFSGIDEENTLIWPEDGEPVDFVAYYPYLEDGFTDYTYPVDISDQSSPGAIDLMWAEVKNVSSGNPVLQFEHKLTKLLFNITDRSGASLSDMVSSFDGLNTTAGFNLASGKMLPDTAGDPKVFEVMPASTSDPAEDEGEGDGMDEVAVVEVIVLPGEDLSYTITFTLDNDEKAIFEVENADYEPGRRYIYNISLMPRLDGVEFGDTSGELKSITDWDDVTDGDEYELPRKGDDDDPPVTGAGETWNSGVLAEDSDKYTVDGTGGMFDSEGYLIVKDGHVTITKDDYEDGIATITVKLAHGGGMSAVIGEISSVKVDGVPLVFGEGESAVEIAPISSLTESTDFLFRTSDGKPVSGEIEIVIKVDAGRLVVNSFKVN